MASVTTSPPSADLSSQRRTQRTLPRRRTWRGPASHMITVVLNSNAQLIGG